LRFPLAEIGAQRCVQPGPALGFRIIPPIGHGQAYTGGLRGEMLGKLAWIFPLWQGPRAMCGGYVSRLRAPT
jgi:hypothetical protein